MTCLSNAVKKTRIQIYYVYQLNSHKVFGLYRVLHCITIHIYVQRDTVMGLLIIKIYTAIIFFLFLGNSKNVCYSICISYEDCSNIKMFFMHNKDMIFSTKKINSKNE